MMTGALRLRAMCLLGQITISILHVIIPCFNQLTVLPSRRLPSESKRLDYIRIIYIVTVTRLLRGSTVKLMDHGLKIQVWLSRLQ